MLLLVWGSYVIIRESHREPILRPGMKPKEAAAVLTAEMSRVEAGESRGLPPFRRFWYDQGSPEGQNEFVTEYYFRSGHAFLYQRRTLYWTNGALERITTERYWKFDL